MEINNHIIKTNSGVIVLSNTALRRLVKAVVCESLVSLGKNNNHAYGLRLIDPNRTSIIMREQGRIDISIHLQVDRGVLLPKAIPDLRNTIENKLWALARLVVRKTDVWVEKIIIPGKSN